MILTVTWRFWVNIFVILLIFVSLSASAIVQLRLADGSSVFVWTAEEMAGLDLLLAKITAERDAAIRDAKKAKVCI